jgi:hypothetical protein
VSAPRLLPASLLLALSLLLLLPACESAGGGVPDDTVVGSDAESPPDIAGPDVVGDLDAATPPDGAVTPDVAPDAAPDVAADVPPDVPGPPVVCTAGTHWAPGRAIFVERTEAWGLVAAGAQGTRISVVDVDGDGWADLLVRRGGTQHDELGEGGARHTWLLRNVPGVGFEDVTFSSNLLVTRQAHDPSVGRPNQVFAAADVDNDGDLDLYAGIDTNNPDVALGETSELLLNDGTGRFELGPEENEVRRVGAVDMPSSGSFFDWDRDGLVDLWVGEHNYDANGSVVFQQSRLYRGNGAGAFFDMTAPAGLVTLDWRTINALNQGLCHTRSWSTAACDLNGDGTAELLSASYGRAPNHLFQWDPTASRYVNRSVASGYAYDGDQTWEDNQFARCYCQANRQAVGCADVPAPNMSCSQPNWVHEQDREPFRLGGNSAATVCADLDGDGDLDLLTTELQHWWAGQGADHTEILRNDGGPDVTFTRPGREATGRVIPHVSADWDEGIMSAAVFDFDNDGWPDVYLGGSDYPGNRGFLYHHEGAAGGGLSFVEVATADFFEHNRSHGVVAVDIDHDGDLDLVVGHSRSRCYPQYPNDCYETQQVRVFENVLGQDGNWLQVRLTGGPRTNRAAIGARVTVTAGGVTQTQEVDGGHGHYNTQKDLVLHFGLGAACEAEVTVRWPDQALTTETATLPGGYRYEWTQGAEPRAVR